MQYNNTYIWYKYWRESGDLTFPPFVQDKFLMSKYRIYYTDTDISPTSFFSMPSTFFFFIQTCKWIEKRFFLRHFFLMFFHMIQQAIFIWKKNSHSWHWKSRCVVWEVSWCFFKISSPLNTASQILHSYNSSLFSTCSPLLWHCKSSSHLNLW